MMQNQPLNPHANFMDQAIEYAYGAYAQGEVPIGAVLVYQDKVIAASGNQVEAKTNPIFHAEICVIEQACRILQTKYLNLCDLYVTVEPCAMCAGAISFSRIRAVYFSIANHKMGAFISGPQLFSGISRLYAPKFFCGLGSQESLALMQRFFQEKRQEKKRSTSNKG